LEGERIASSGRLPVNEENNMIVTGIAHPPSRLHEKKQQPSLELDLLAVRALQAYPATRLVTTLAPGWEQALAKAALELEIPFAVTIPFPKPGLTWQLEARKLYQKLLAQAGEARTVIQRSSPPVLPGDHAWRIDQADLILALWDYEFQGEAFAAIDYALKAGKKVVNLWQDWEAMLSLRKVYGLAYAPRRNGAQVYESRKPAN
jgi:hypothetical protein